MISRFFLLLFGFFTLAFCVNCNTSSKNILEQILKTPDAKIQNVLKNRRVHEVQIRYTQIERDSLNRPHFKHWSYGLDESRYFYPASTAKLPIAVLALEKLNALQGKGVAVDMHTPFQVWDSKTDTLIVKRDSTHSQGHITVAHLIKKIFLVSDNDAYNYLFDFLGKNAINERFQTLGLKNTQIHHKFLLGADNGTTWEYTFLKDADTLYRQASIRASFKESNAALKGVRKGKGYYADGDLIESPMDFSFKNRISILDLEGILQRVLFPEVFPEKQRFKLTEEQYAFLHFWMGRNTLESKTPNYNSQDYWDSYVKFFVYGDTKGEMRDSLRIYNKVGYAYGTLTDVAYLQNQKKGIEFFLTASVLVNENGIFNDDTYEYESLGIPFLAALGRAVYDYETNSRSVLEDSL